MKKIIIFGSFLIASLVLISSCSSDKNFIKQIGQMPTANSVSNKEDAYGYYLAARTAHIRKDYKNAVNYYIKAYEKNPSDRDLLNLIYMISLSEGDIETAYKYALIADEINEDNNFIAITIMSKLFKNKQYQDAISYIDNLEGDAYKNFFAPMIKSWAYIAMNQEDKAWKSMKLLKEDEGFSVLYNFHMGMMNDYLGKNEDALKYYNLVIEDNKVEMSFRSIQIIGNFLIRTGQKDRAISIAKQYAGNNSDSDIIDAVVKRFYNSNIRNVKPVITSADIGVSETMFGVAATLSQANGGDIAQLFIQLSIYFNENYDLAKLLLGTIYEARDDMVEANDIYSQIDKKSDVYFSVQLKIINNLIQIEDFDLAEILLKNLIIDYPESYQLHTDLGDVLRVKKQYELSIKSYESALKLVSEQYDYHWVIHYALGISYERIKDYKNSEIHLLKSLALNSNQYLVKNYLGYSWLEQKRNIQPALQLIIDAYTKAPEDGYIVDSLGWAFYQIGDYEQAIKYLERAFLFEPNNAVIADHLGDVYWQIGRKTEAIYHWNHVLQIEDDTDEISPQKIKDKIKNGIDDFEPLTIKGKKIKIQIMDKVE